MWSNDFHRIPGKSFYFPENPPTKQMCQLLTRMCVHTHSHKRRKKTLGSHFLIEGLADSLPVVEF